MAQILWLWNSIAYTGKNAQKAREIHSWLWNSIARGARFLAAFTSLGKLAAQTTRGRLFAGAVLLLLLTLLMTACSGKSFELLTDNPGGGAADTTAPTTPVDFAPLSSDSAQIQLSWVASSDDTTPQTSIVYEICQTITSGNCSGGSYSVTYSVTGQTSFTTPSLTNGTTYFFTIRAKDAANNVSTISAEVRATAASSPQWRQTAYLKAPNTATSDYFGTSVAVSGSVIVVGADREDSNSTTVCNAPFGVCSGLSDNSAMDAGAAYVFERDVSGNWQQKAYLKAPNTEADDRFSYSVSVSGSVIVVGAPYEDSNSTAVCNAPFGSCSGLSNNSAVIAGAVYVFERDTSGNWQQKAYLKAPNTETGDRFGYSVSVSGSVIVVGAYLEDSNSTAICNAPFGSCTGLSNNSATDAGAAYVFERDASGNWQQKAYLKAPNTETDDRFGYSVSVSGSVIVVGAIYEDSNSTVVRHAPFGTCSCLSNNSASAAGAAYVFERDGSGNWQQTAYLKAPNAGENDNFGYSVSISGSVIVVGAYGEASNSTAVCNAPFGTCSGLSDNSVLDAGAAYVFERNGSGNWQQKAYLKAPNTGGIDNFGWSVAVSGSVIVVGAYGEDSNSTAVCNAPFGSCTGLSDNSASTAGAAYVFEHDGCSGNWQQKAYLKAPNTQSGDGFAYSVAVSGSVIVVGAYREDSNSTTVCNAPFGSCSGLSDNSATDAGAAYVFEKK